MRFAARIVMTLALAVLIASSATAEEKKKKKGNKGKKAPSAVKVPKGIELTAAQTEQVAALNKEYGPKLAEINKKYAAIVSPEQRKARQEAAKAAKAAGKKGKEARAEVDAALNLTADQKSQLKEVQAARQALSKEVQGKFVDLLTPEQKEKIKKPAKGKKKKKDAAK